MIRIDYSNALTCIRAQSSINVSDKGDSFFFELNLLTDAILYQ